MILVGLDEAGRGPVLGPLVVAGVAVEDADLPARLGCTDSKRLSPDRRRAIERSLRSDGGVRIAMRQIEADELDRRRAAGESLTAIEVKAFQEIGTELGATTLIVDAAHPDAAAFAALLRPGLPAGTRIKSEHKADLNHPIVGAASIVAKVARDEAVAQLARRLERILDLPLGSGYPSDATTRRFLTAWWRTHKSWPEGTRTGWATLRDLAAPQPVPLDSFDATL